MSCALHQQIYQQKMTFSWSATDLAVFKEKATQISTLASNFQKNVIPCKLVFPRSPLAILLIIQFLDGEFRYLRVACVTKLAGAYFRKRPNKTWTYAKVLTPIMTRVPRCEFMSIKRKSFPKLYIKGWLFLNDIYKTQLTGRTKNQLNEFNRKWEAKF